MCSPKARDTKKNKKVNFVQQKATCLLKKG